MLSIWFPWSEVVSSFSVVQMHVWFHEASFGLQGAPQLCLTMLQAIDFPIFHREPAKLQTKKSTLKSKRTISTILYKAAPQDQDHTDKKKQQTSNKRHLRYFPFLAKPTRFSSPQYPNKIMTSFGWHYHSSHCGGVDHRHGCYTSGTTSSSSLYRIGCRSNVWWNARNRLTSINSLRLFVLNGNRRSLVSTTRKALQIFLATCLHPQGNLHIDGLNTSGEAVRRC